MSDSNSSSFSLDSTVLRPGALDPASEELFNELCSGYSLENMPQIRHTLLHLLSLIAKSGQIQGITVSFLKNAVVNFINAPTAQGIVIPLPYGSSADDTSAKNPTIFDCLKDSAGREFGFVLTTSTISRDSVAQALKSEGLEPTNDSSTLSLTLVVDPVTARPDQNKFVFQPVSQSEGKSLDFLVGASVPKAESDALKIGLVEPARKRRKIAEENEDSKIPTPPQPARWCVIM